MHVFSFPKMLKGQIIEVKIWDLFFLTSMLVSFGAAYGRSARIIHRNPVFEKKKLGNSNTTFVVIIVVYILRKMDME